MRCPGCRSTKTNKNGFVQERQRYKCKRCFYQFTNHPPRGVPLEVKRLAIEMYLEGLGFR